MTDLAILAFADRAAWKRWLAAQHAATPELWLKLAKKDAGIASVTYAEALEVALCYGWIDGQKKPFDDQFWLQRFTPRGSKSKWSKINRDKAALLISSGEMQPAGLQQIELAKQDGRWDAAYESQSVATVPDDLQRALNKNRKARDFFATLNSANRYAVLYRIQDAKKPETRARRIEKFVQMLSEGKKLHP